MRGCSKKRRARAGRRCSIRRLERAALARAVFVRAEGAVGDAELEIAV